MLGRERPEILDDEYWYNSRTEDAQSGPYGSAFYYVSVFSPLSHTFESPFLLPDAILLLH